MAAILANTVVVNIHAHHGKRPQFDIYIGRATPYTEFKESSKWANKFKPKNYTDPQKCLDDYEADIRAKIARDPVKYNLEELRGKRLGCWCKPGPCHGDILIKLLNEISCLKCGQKKHTGEDRQGCIICSKFNVDCCGHKGMYYPSECEMNDGNLMDQERLDEQFEADLEAEAELLMNDYNGDDYDPGEDEERHPSWGDDD
jgi:hypothetical protein